MEENERTSFVRMALIDDNEADRDYIGKLILACFKEAAPFSRPFLATFPSAEAFLFAYEESEPFDILFLDVEMPGLSGISLAKKIRQTDENIQLVFVTGYSDYIAEGYDVSALHYLIKPVQEKKLSDVLQKAISLIQKNELFLPIQTKEGLERIPLSDIRYVEVYSNYITLHAKKDYTVKRTLSSLEKELDNRFYRIGRSCIINLAYVRSVHKDAVVLLDGSRILIPKNAYEGLAKAIIARL